MSTFKERSHCLLKHLHRFTGQVVGQSLAACSTPLGEIEQDRLVRLVDQQRPHSQLSSTPRQLILSYQLKQTQGHL